MSDKNRQKLREYSQNKYYSMSQEDRQKKQRTYERIQEKKNPLCKPLVSVILYSQLYRAVENAATWDIEKRYF